MALTTRRSLLLLTMVAVGLLVIGGVAWAATVKCQVGVPCDGTDEPDKLIGTNNPDQMNAKQDDDLLLGLGGSDGMLGDDFHAGNPIPDGDDKLFGNNGEDNLIAFGGNDLLRGGRGADILIARDDPSTHPGEDIVRGGGGQDFIIAADGFKDTIDCGADVDRVRFDEGLDVVADNCETLEPE